MPRHKQQSAQNQQVQRALQQFDALALFFLLYWLSAIAIVVAGVPAISSGWRTVIWTVALGTMGVACIVNVLRFGRVHCYLTGPFFHLMALIALSYGLGLLNLGENGWTCSA